MAEERVSGSARVLEEVPTEEIDLLLHSMRKVKRKANDGEPNVDHDHVGLSYRDRLLSSMGFNRGGEDKSFWGNKEDVPDLNWYENPVPEKVPPIPPEEA